MLSAIIRFTLPSSVMTLLLFQCTTSVLAQATSRVATASRPTAEFIAHSQITRGVRQIAAPGVPGPLLVYGEHAFAVAVGKNNDVPAPVVAAARFGKGRVIVFGHTGYLDAASLTVGDTAALLTNAICWVSCAEDRVDNRSANSDPAAKLRVGVADDQPFATALLALGFDAASISSDQLTEDPNRFDVICLGQAGLDARQVQSVRDFIRSGHGLLMAGLGWGWLQLNPGKTVDDHPGNRLLAEAGLAWADGTLDRTSRHGFAVGPAVAPNCHAMTALQTLRADASHAAPVSPDELALASTTMLLAVRTLPEADSSLLPEIHSIADRRHQTLVPSESVPFKSVEHALERVLLAYEIHKSNRTTDRSQAHPGAKEFPGAVFENAPRVDRSIDVTLAVPGWHSTGLYAAPGEPIAVRFSGTDVPAGLAIRIGAHTDLLWHHAAWKRVPEISRSLALIGRETRLASSFGGLIYIECPDKGGGTVRIQITGAVEAPHYILNHTDLDDWQRTIRHRPAPWSELESAKIIVTVPSAAIRDLDDPKVLMDFWDRIADAHATLATIPLERRRPERFVADVQISAGYMHAGYPIMTHLDAVDDMTRLDKLRRGNWGLLHELGHNHQSADWTFDGTGEVTCNLFSLHAMDTVCQPPAGSRGHPAVNKPPSVSDYRKRGARFEEWKRDPFLALQMYIQLERAFGWDTFKRVFAEYRALPARQRPGNDDEKRDQWLVRFSRACGRNLGPFFQAWGVPTSQAARTSIAGLPSWMPDDLPTTRPSASDRR